MPMIRTSLRQRESGARLIRSVQALLRRVATALAVMATLAFVLDGARAVDHHGAGSANGGHHHVHVHSHGDAASAHHHVHGHHVHADVAGLDQGSSPVSTTDGANCCCGVSCAAVLLPCLNAQAVPFVLLQAMATIYRHPGDGIEPDGLRRPPRPLAIA